MEQVGASRQCHTNGGWPHGSLALSRHGMARVPRSLARRSWVYSLLADEHNQSINQNEYMYSTEVVLLR